MMPDPTFKFSEANRRIADAQAVAAAERLVRGTPDRPDRRGLVSTLRAAFRRRAPSSKPSTTEPTFRAAHPR